MTVGELIEALQQEDPARLVILAKDSEGNSYSPLASYCTGSYRAESTWSGEFGLEGAPTEEEWQQGYSEADVVDGVPALKLSPRC